MITLEDACSICFLCPECQPHSSLSLQIIFLHITEAWPLVSPEFFSLQRWPPAERPPQLSGSQVQDQWEIAYWPSLGHKPSSRPINCFERRERCVCVCVCLWVVVSYHCINSSWESNLVGMKGTGFSGEGGSPEKIITHKSTIVLLEKRERIGLDDE